MMRQPCRPQRIHTWLEEKRSLGKYFLGNAKRPLKSADKKGIRYTKYAKYFVERAFLFERVLYYYKHTLLSISSLFPSPPSRAKSSSSSSSSTCVYLSSSSFSISRLPPPSFPPSFRRRPEFFPHRWQRLRNATMTLLPLQQPGGHVVRIRIRICCVHGRMTLQFATGASRERALKSPPPPFPAGGRKKRK